MLVVALLAGLAFSFGLAEATNCKGCTPLDVLTFDKLVDKFPAALIKFDVAFPYGDKQDHFAKVAESVADVPNLLAGEVGIKDYGDKDNEELAKRFKVVKDDYPVVILFVTEEGERKEYRFGKNDEFTEENLKSFVKQKSGIYLPLPGCMEEFDNLAARLMSAGSAGEKGKVMAEAEKAFAATTDNKKADIYLKIMRKIVAEGPGVPDTEMARVMKVIAGGKVSEEKRNSMKQRLNVLRSFMQTQPQKEEL